MTVPPTLYWQRFSNVNVYGLIFTTTIAITYVC
jgi:hypothetical protein